MARPQKPGLSYFPLDTNIFYSPEIKGLKRRHGTDGICCYLYLLAQIYEDNGYYTEFDEDTILALADELGMKEGAVRQVMTYLTGRSLLTRINLPGTSTRPSPVTVITSAGIQRRWQAAKSDSGRKTALRVDPRIWLLGSDETESFIKFTLPADSSGKNESFSGKNADNSGITPINKRKVDKSKGEDSINSGEAANSSPAAITDRELMLRKMVDERLPAGSREPFLAYIGYLMAIEGRSISEPRIKGYLTRLTNLSSDPEEQAKICDQSRVKGWKGLFPLGREGSRTAPPFDGQDRRMRYGQVEKHPAGKFANFTQREYDPQTLEALLLSEYWHDDVNEIHGMDLDDDVRDAIDWDATMADYQGRRIHYRNGRDVPVEEWKMRHGTPSLTAVNFER